MRPRARLFLGGLPFLVLGGLGVPALLLPAVNIAGICAVIVALGLMLGVVCGPRRAVVLTLALPPLAAQWLWGPRMRRDWLVDPFALVERCATGGVAEGLRALLRV